MFTYLKGRLKQMGIDQNALAMLMHLSQPAVSQRFTGRVPWTLDEMYWLMDLCKADPAELHIYFPKGGVMNERT